MSKKDNTQISSYYKKKDVVESYDDRRFSGSGGKYIHKYEVLPVLKILSKLRVSSVLDLGAGRGRLSTPLNLAGYDVDCLDFSEEMASVLKELLPDSKIYKQSIFDEIPSKKTYGCVTGLRFFDHFSMKDQLKIVKNISRVLKSNDHLLVPTMNKNSLEYAFSKLFPYGRYNYFYSKNEYEKELAQLGFNLVLSNSSFFVPRGFFLRFRNNTLLVNLLKLIDKLGLMILPNQGGYQYLLFTKK